MASGTAVTRRGMTIVVAKRPSPGPARLGLAVRSDRGAVERNRVKRRLRAAFAEVAVHRDFDVVIRADGRGATVPWEVLTRTIADAIADARDGTR